MKRYKTMLIHIQNTWTETICIMWHTPSLRSELHVLHPENEYTLNDIDFKLTFSNPPSMDRMGALGSCPTRRPWGYPRTLKFRYNILAPLSKRWNLKANIEGVSNISLTFFFKFYCKHLTQNSTILSSRSVCSLLLG